MKLICCLECGDVVKLAAETRTCKCGASGGRYADQLNAEIWGECIPLGLSNQSLATAIRAQPEGPGPGRRFAAFVIPKRCDTVRVVEKPEE